MSLLAGTTTESVAADRSTGEDRGREAQALADLIVVPARNPAVQGEAEPTAE